MAIYEVRALFNNGTAKGRYCYKNSNHGCTTGDCCSNSLATCTAAPCNCGAHTAGAGLCCPADIHGPDGSQVKLWASSNILSAKAKHTGFCANNPPPAFPWVNRGAIMELYCGPNATGALIGKVLYGHLFTRVVNHDQIYNNPNGLLIGTISNTWCNCSGCSGGVCSCGSCCCNCYPQGTSHHVHMGRTSGNSGETRSWTCDTPVGTGYWIYRWTLGNCPS